ENQESWPLLAPATRNSLLAIVVRSGSSAREKCGRLLKSPSNGLVVAWTSPRPVWWVRPSTYPSKWQVSQVNRLRRPSDEFQGAMRVVKKSASPRRLSVERWRDPSSSPGAGADPGVEERIREDEVAVPRFLDHRAPRGKRAGVARALDQRPRMLRV